MKHITTEQAKIAFCKSQCKGCFEIINCVRDGGCIDYISFVKTLKRIKGDKK